MVNVDWTSFPLRNMARRYFLQGIVVLLQYIFLSKAEKSFASNDYVI